MVDEIPVVDFAGLSLRIADEDLSDISLPQTAAQIVHALETVGFVYLTNTGFPDDQIADITSVAQQFFDLPTPMKSRYQRDKNVGNFGWVASEQERIRPSEPGDLKECFDVKLSLLDCDASWPTNDVPAFKPTAMQFCDSAIKLAERVMIAIARGINLPDQTFFTNNHHMKGANSLTLMRVLYYPPLPEDREIKPNQVRLGEHTDYGTITLLFQDDIGGLQVKTSSGQWIDATPVSDTVLVNIGDLLQRWTADKLKSTPHRVQLPDSQAKRLLTRRSVVLFVNPDPDVIVAPLDGTDKYPPITAGEYLDGKLDASYDF